MSRARIRCESSQLRARSRSMPSPLFNRLNASSTCQRIQEAAKTSAAVALSAGNEVSTIRTQPTRASLAAAHAGPLLAVLALRRPDGTGACLLMLTENNQPCREKPSWCATLAFVAASDEHRDRWYLLEPCPRRWRRDRCVLRRLSPCACCSSPRQPGSLRPTAGHAASLAAWRSSDRQ